MNIKPDLINTMKKNKIDYGCTALYLLSFIIFIVEAFLLQMIPTKYLAILIAALLILFFIFVILDIKEMAGMARWSKRVCTIVLSICLLFGSSYMFLINRAIGNVEVGGVMKDKISLMVLADSPLESVADLSNYKIGYQDANDKSNSDYVIDVLLGDDTLHNATYEPYSNYVDLCNALSDGTIQGMIFTDSYISTVEEKIDDFTKRFKTISTFEKTSSGNTNTTTKDISNEPFTVFISGMDEMGEPTINLRSDVNLLLLVNPLTNHIEMVSIPRDAYVPNVATNNYPDKLTHTGLFGIDTTIKTMENVFGFDINYYAKVSFTSLIEIVDILGGIEADIPINFCEQDENRNFNNPICLNAGVQSINGRQALAYARHRKSYGDIERTMAQQDVIKGIINRILSVDGVSKVPSLLEVGPKYVSTNVPMEQVKKLVNSELDTIEPWTFSTIHMENGLFDLLPTASMGADIPLSVYMLNQNDVQMVYEKYLAMYETFKLNDFNFDLNDLNKNKVYPKEIPEMIWSSNYQTKVLQFYSLIYPEDEPEEEDPSENPEGDPNDPNVPVNPDGPMIDPDEPVVPNPDEPLDPTDPSEPVDPTIPLDPSSPVDPNTPLPPE